MKAEHFLIIFIVVSIGLIAAATFHYSVEPTVNFKVTDMEVLFYEENATADIEYEVGFLTQIYVFFFGSRNLNPFLDELLYDFEEYRVISVHGTTATVELINASRLSGSYYLHDTHMLGFEVGKLTLKYPDGKTLTFENATETPNTFY
ncbi:hypothetical protein LJC08_02680 [Methanimicrococcus sp. OttesenSCG-928-J09]|nr:hypothetical protein [Methanimicrococcus sp. OttesenSCG-928-J09]